MMVSTFLMTFPNGHILYLGSWHRERHPTMVYEDEDEPTTPGTREQTNQWHGKWHWELALIVKTAVLCGEGVSYWKHCTFFTYLKYVKNSFDFENTQLSQLTIGTWVLWGNVLDCLRTRSKTSQIICINETMRVYMLFTSAPFEQEPHCMHI